VQDTLGDAAEHQGGECGPASGTHHDGVSAELVAASTI